VLKKTIVALLSIAALGSWLFPALPRDTRFEILNSVKRPFSPNFDLPPKAMKRAHQIEWVAEYMRRGYELNCYGNLRPEERLSKDDDFICRAIIRSAYDNIPARSVFFWFRRNELQNIKLEFPEESFPLLQDYLKRYFVGVRRLDRAGSAAFGTDIYGRPLMVWPTDNGMIVVSSAPTPGRPLTLLWISKEKVLRDIVEGLFPRAMGDAKSSTAQPGTPIHAMVLSQPAGTARPEGALAAEKPLPARANRPSSPSSADAVTTDERALQSRSHKPYDLRQCLELQSNDAVAKCVDMSR